MDIEEGQEVPVKGIDDVLNKIIVENVPNLETYRVIQAKEAFTTSTRQDQKRNIPRHIIVKTLNIHNKDRILKAEREK
jgi:hypothetical protein